MDKEFLETIKPLLRTGAMFGTFFGGDGTGKQFCSSCLRVSDLPVNGIPSQISHKENCGFIAHARAKEALRLALQDAGIEIT